MCDLLVFYDVEHELVVEQADEVEAAKAGRTAQGQVTDDHAGVEGPPRNFLIMNKFFRK
jgi:hypothetical protein